MCCDENIALSYLHITNHLSCCKIPFCLVRPQRVHLHVRIEELAIVDVSAIKKKQNRVLKHSAQEMPRLHEASRNRAMGMLTAGVVKHEVVWTTSRPLIRYRHTQDVKDTPRSVSPQTTSRRQDDNIRVTHQRDRFTPAPYTAVSTRGTRGYVNSLPLLIGYWIYIVNYS